MSPVEFKKMPCRPVEFKGQGPKGRVDGAGGTFRESILGNKGKTRCTARTPVPTCTLQNQSTRTCHINLRGHRSLFLQADLSHAQLATNPLTTTKHLLGE